MEHEQVSELCTRLMLSLELQIKYSREFLVLFSEGSFKCIFFWSFKAEIEGSSYFSHSVNSDTKSLVLQLAFSRGKATLSFYPNTFSEEMQICVWHATTNQRFCRDFAIGAPLSCKAVRLEQNRDFNSASHTGSSYFHIRGERNVVWRNGLLHHYLRWSIKSSDVLALSWRVG